MASYEYTNLTSALGDAQSPVSIYLRERFPHRREVMAEFKGAGTQLRVPSFGANPGTVGMAFDLVAAFTLNSAHETPWAGYPVRSLEMRVACDVLSIVAGQECAPDRPLSADGARACWALALFAEAFRSTRVWPDSTLALYLAEGSPSAEGLVALALPNEIEELQALHEVAVAELYGELAAYARGPVRTGVVVGSGDLCSAEADVVAGGLLLDVKTRMGRNTAAGRSDVLDLKDLYQVVAYFLLDTEDELGLDHLGWYSARFGNLAVYSALDLLDNMANTPSVDVHEERRRMRALLAE